MRIAQLIGSPAFPADSAATAERAEMAYDRSHDEAAIVRQAVATVASGDRTPNLRELDLPALVLHGLADTMCDPSGGRATAAAIAGARLVLIEGMGHNLPPGLWEPIAENIAGVVEQGERRLAVNAERMTNGKSKGVHMTSSDQKDLVKQYIDKVWNRGDLKALHRLTTPTFKYRIGEQAPRDRAGMQHFLAVTRTAFPEAM